MAATRTQIYLTADQRRRIDAVRRRRGVTLAQVVREALDAYLVEPTPDVAGVLEATFGTDPDFEVPSRGEWERRVGA